MRAAGLVVALAACGGGSGGGGGGASGSAPAPVAPPAPAPATPADAGAITCLPFGKWYGVHTFRVDERAVTLCTADRICPTKHPVCVAYDLASGKQTSVPPPVEPPPAPPGYQVKSTAGALELCRPDGKCSKLPFKATARALIDHRLHVAISPDGKIAAIAGEALGGPMFLVDAASGKQLARVVGEQRDANCLVQPHFLGTTIYARACSHSFPMHTDYLFRSDGSRIAPVVGVAMPLSDQPIQIAGTRWAVHLEEGDGYLVFDATTGERVRTVPEKPPHPHEYDEPERRGPLKSPSGKLVLLGEEITVSDPATGKIEQTWPLPFCADRKAPEPSCP